MTLRVRQFDGTETDTADWTHHETLRHDPIFAVAVGKAINKENQSNILAGKSTLNRLEHCPEDVCNKADSRYHRIEHDAESIETLLVELFLETYGKPPRQELVPIHLKGISYVCGLYLLLTF